MRQAIIDLAGGRERGTHPGLLLQRYLAKQSDPSERRSLLDATRQAGRSAPLRSVHAAAFGRWKSSFAPDKPFQQKLLETVGRLIVGLGTENVLETGLTLHHTYGVPIIPGSALKGLASHYCHDVWGRRHDELAPEGSMLFRRGGKHHSLLFGTPDDGGIITFHDAWIVPESLNEGALRLDVMTPHHPKWQRNDAPPTDFDSPVPVSFLSVAGTFDVRLSWSGPAGAPRDQAEGWTALAMQLLQEALAEWGVGGKTSSGYGRLVAADLLRDDRRPSTNVVADRAIRPKPGEKVEAQLLDEKTRRGGWKAKHVPSGMIGPIQNSGDVPADRNPGDGRTFKALKLHESRRSPLTARNQSVLAHGFQPVGYEVLERLWEAAIQLGGFAEQDLPIFPRLAKPEGGQ